MSLGKLRASADPVRVLVELKVRAPGKDDLRRLEELGLTVERVIRNTVVGRIPDEKISVLQSDDLVAAVERSRKLDLHD